MLTPNQEQWLHNSSGLVLEILVLHFLWVFRLLLGVDVLRHLPHLQDVVLRHRRAHPVVVRVPAKNRNTEDEEEARKIRGGR